MPEAIDGARPARILEIVADGAPGGGTTAVLGLCTDLIAMGEREVALVTDAGSYAAAQARQLGIDVHELGFFTSRFDPRIRAGLRRLIGKLRPDVIHAHGARAALPLAAIERGEAARVYTVHGYHFAKKRWPMRTLARAAEARIAREVDYGIFVSNADRIIAAENGIRFEDTSVIYNGILFDDLPGNPASAPTHDLVFSARMHRQKNPLFVVEVMALLAPSGIRLAMIGGGELEAEVRAAATARGLGHAIDFYGALPRSDALARVRDARLFLLPSLWEGLPIAPIEALALGVPVIGSDIPGTREVVTDGVTGLLVAGFDPAAWAARIRGALADPAALDSMRNAGRTDVGHRFTRARSSAAHQAVYRQLLTGAAHAALPA